MRFLRILAVIFVLTFAAFGQTTPNVAVLGELKKFYDSYAEDLVQKRTDSIADRYDRRGTFMLGNGAKDLVSYEKNKTFYTTKWTGPDAFAWKNLDYEILSPTAALVIGQFEWKTEKDPKPMTCSYSGLVVKIKEAWYIRVEDESCPPAK